MSVYYGMPNKYYFCVFMSHKMVLRHFGILYNCWHVRIRKMSDLTTLLLLTKGQFVEEKIDTRVGKYVVFLLFACQCLDLEMII